MPNFAVILQYVIPKQLLTIIAGKLAHAEAGRLTTSVIRWFIKRYNVNMSEAAEPNINGYQTFNLFFYPRIKKWH